MKYLLVSLLMVVGCGGIATVPGDTYTTMVENDGMPTWVRRYEDKAVCEYFYNGGRWLEVGYDIDDWSGWRIGSQVASINPVKATAVEPRVKWVRYDIGAAWRSLSRD